MYKPAIKGDFSPLPPEPPQQSREKQLNTAADRSAIDPVGAQYTQSAFDSQQTVGVLFNRDVGWEGW
jgi:hypothetical protein